MRERLPDIDSLSNPLASMMQQSQLAFELWIIYEGTPTGNKALETHQNMERAIKQYIKENKAPWL